MVEDGLWVEAWEKAGWRVSVGEEATEARTPSHILYHVELLFSA